jgi:large subunit ribosomal protein L4e
MNATVRDLDGEEAGTTELPAVFETTYRPDLIKRAVLAAQANSKQDYGAEDYAGMKTPAESFGSGRGQAHVPRQDGVGRRVPQTVGGRRAHPPKEEKERGLDINDKERQLAVRSAIAATGDGDLVAERGHDFDDDVVEFPLVVDDDFEDLEKTSDAADAFAALGIDADVDRADEATVRAGRGTTRGRTRRRPSSVLVVTSEDPSRAARNLAGVDVTTAREVNAEDLAPGTLPGRLTLWTESAVSEVADR